MAPSRDASVSAQAEDGESPTSAAARVAVHEIVALKSYRDQLRATLAGIDAEIAAKNTKAGRARRRVANWQRRGQRLKTPRAAKAVAERDGEGGLGSVFSSSSPRLPCKTPLFRFSGPFRPRGSIGRCS